MDLRPSFSSSSSSYEWAYDVFLNFRGGDTRYGFCSHLYNALCQKGIHTFIDDVELQRSDKIRSSVVKVIENSRIAVLVFSENYASSSFCLEELAAIMERVRGKGRWVLPVFYGVNPSDVRHQRGSYGKALARHEEMLKEEKVQKWRAALSQAADLSGYYFEPGNQYEHVFIHNVVKEISNKINRVRLHVADYPVGLDSRVLEVNKLLNDVSDDGVRIVGIWGMGGIGKTTLARAVFNLIAEQFESSCFLENVRENSIIYGLTHLQKMLLFEILGEDIKIASVSGGMSVIKHRLRSKKVLLVLDDVNKVEQLQAIAQRLDWFGFGSKVIITTRDKYLLAVHGVDREYEVGNLNVKEALELLKWKGFGCEKVDPSYMDILTELVTYTSGIPLALEVIGSNLFGKSIEEWRSALDRYERIPNQEIQNILKISYDALEEYQQSLFLDIACFFNGYALEEVENILYAHYDVCLKRDIGVLLEKSLIKINRVGHVTLDNLIQVMGREIVRQESPLRPGRRSRLWHPEDIIQVLENNMGSEEIEIIVLDSHSFDKTVVKWDGKAFKKMGNLKTLIIRDAHFSQGPRYLPNSLRVLEWWNYPSNSLPLDFHPKKLAILKLPHSGLMSIRFLEKQKLKNLIVLILDWSNIEEIADLSGASNLKELSFSDCENLSKIHESVGKMKYIGDNYLKCTSIDEFLSFIKNLTGLPSSIGKLLNLEEVCFERFEELQFLKQYESEEQGSSVVPPEMNSLNDHMNWDSNSFTYANNVRGCGIASRKRQRSALILDLGNESSETFCHASSKVDLDSDSVTSRLASDTPSEGVVPDYPENTLAESSQAPGFAEMQNIQAPCLTLSSGIVSGEEPHLETCCTEVATPTDESLRNQIDISHDDVEMEAFYACLAETHVLSCFHDKLATSAPSEEAKEALKIVQDFITNNDASVLLHPERCNVVKARLGYLSNLTADDGLSGEMGALISEALRVFTHCSSNYIEASMRIESIASELRRADELLADLEDNKYQFKEVMTLEKELSRKLACLDENKKDLEKQINVISADISASLSEQNMTRKRKRDILEERHILVAQTDELRENVLHLQHEQDLAKERQGKIKDEWLELRKILKSSFE